MKRGRSATSRSLRHNEAKKDFKLEDDSERKDTEESFVEEILTVEEKRTILLRFPCLDFFRNAHICETLCNSAQDASKGGTSGMETKFAPEALRFDADTLETPHPIVRLRTREFGELVFEGTWCQVSEINGGRGSMSNRVVVHLCERSDEQSSGEVDKAVSGDNVGINRSNKSPLLSGSGSNSLSGSGVASLLKHSSVGVTADDARGQRRAQNALWFYNRIDVPCGTLVLARVK
ncbi:hypothetical protein, conserved [Trypanosoma brucei gambiense DAL972]|uniref:Uncharacterized protein n=2 Tax=Trypanosoma brucei TaxID=5691 RepID=D0A5V2_TRYB9|nr:hypothetical protein, conserved [Trypanosoma brucei gambiense DAL972]RHW68100.1 hypothetical protein DPX39_110022100 [Trypanosoma brucei equiperdum]CBH17053.1 hypothetical protein, conserved [Trypanosoma brucei gambiense DAL972]|eukprot:XP_011779317.1 hypothetical protein, conserved [Trypanosoma brucei gambiense DAL972]